MRRGFAPARVGLAVALCIVWAGLGGCSDDAGPNDPSGRGSGSSSSGSTSSGGEEPFDPTPRVRYVGRVDTSDPAGPRIAWPGTRVIVRFRGPALEVKLNERPIDEGPSRYDVFVDGELTDEGFTPGEGEGEYEIASGLAPGEPHVVELVRRTEALVGVTQILGFQYPDGELLAPPVPPARRIEFLGDSESAGYGIECGDPFESFTGATENARKTFPSLVAGPLKAETHNVSFSGKGVLRNEDSSPEVFEDLYVKSIPVERGAQEWDFSSFRPHVVWIGLGANDYALGASGDRPPPDRDAFGEKYRALVALVREKNPDAQIVCAVEGIVNDDYPPGYEAYSSIKETLETIVEERRAAGDAKVHLAELPRAKESIDLTGCASHPNAAWHEKAASAVVARLREIMGW